MAQYAGNVLTGCDKSHETSPLQTVVLFILKKIAKRWLVLVEWFLSVPWINFQLFPQMLLLDTILVPYSAQWPAHLTIMILPNSFPF